MPPQYTQEQIEDTKNRIESFKVETQALLTKYQLTLGPNAQLVPTKEGFFVITANLIYGDLKFAPGQLEAPVEAPAAFDADA